MKKFVFGLIIGLGLSLASVSFAANKEVVAHLTPFKIMINGKITELKNSIVVIDGTSYLPVREISNLLGYEVEWEEETGTIGLSNDGKKYLNKNKKGGNNSSVSQEQTQSAHFVKDLKNKYSKDGKLNIDLIKIAIENGELDVNSQDYDTGDSLLILCIKENNFPVYDYLKNSGKLNPELPNNEGRTPLHIAVIEKNIFFFGELLAKFNVKTKVKDNFDKYPIDYTEQGSPEYIRLRSYKE